MLAMDLGPEHRTLKCTAVSLFEANEATCTTYAHTQTYVLHAVASLTCVFAFIALALLLYLENKYVCVCLFMLKSLK